MKRLLVSAVLLLATVVGAQPRKGAGSVFDSGVNATPSGRIDEAVFGQLKKLRITPARLCTDEVFLRRVYLDVIGTLPTLAEAKQFLSSKSMNKRRALIDRLLERDEFADYWAMKWSDLLRVKAEFPINLWPNAAKAYHRWIRTCIRDNMPYDRFARELITASGSNFRVAPVNFYRALQSKEPLDLGGAVVLTFMGCRADKWPKDRKEGLATLFSQVGFKGTAEWKEEIVFFDSVKAAKDAKAGTWKTAVLPDGMKMKLSPTKDPRVVFADWLITPENRWFTRNIVNRMWYWMLGRGIIHEPDDIHPDNPPVNSSLLAVLETEFIKSGYDMKHLFRLILTSQTYQLSSVPRVKHVKGEANFANYGIRRLGAEVLIDALCQITGTTEKYESRIPEPFTFIPEDERSIALPDGSITSPFLEMFGRPPRDTGLESERNNNPSAAQRLHLLNSSHIRNKIEKSKNLRSLYYGAQRNPRGAIESLYLTVLSRYPTAAELKIVTAYAQANKGKGGAALIDLTWALLNSTEFLYRH
jgi:hypothetical protein